MHVAEKAINIFSSWDNTVFNYTDTQAISFYSHSFTAFPLTIFN